MRVKDEAKRLAIIDATVDIVYKKGFAGVKMTAIAKEVGVSVATLYVYYKNKEDLIYGVHKALIHKFSVQSRKAIATDLPFKLQLKSLWIYWIKFILSNNKEFNYFKQLKQSPYVRIIAKEARTLNTDVVKELLDKGKKELLIKDIDDTVLIEFMRAVSLHLIALVSQRKMELNSRELDLWFAMLWDAIKQ